MESFILAVCFGGFTLGLFLFTAFLYFLLVKAVQNKEEVPSWMYKIGHALKARVKNSYENTTNRQALQEVNITLLLFIVLNGIVFFIQYSKGVGIPASIYFCLKTEFIMVLGVEFLTSIIKLLMVRPLHVYASANAVQGMLVISSFALLLFLNMTGFPEKAPRIEFNGSTVIIGETKAEELLA